MIFSVFEYIFNLFDSYSYFNEPYSDFLFMFFFFPECGSFLFGRITCTSINFYRECIVPGADMITAIKVHKNLTENQCVFKDTFGYRSNAVWVASGCSGEFYLCFKGGKYDDNGSLVLATKL